MFLKHAMNPATKRQAGFTLLELMIAIGILAIVSVIAAANFAGIFHAISLTSTQKGLVTDLRGAQANAMNGEFAVKWGVHFVNGATQYYEVFRTPSNYADVGKVVTATTMLPASITFTDPAPSTVKDIIFDRTTGVTAASSVTVSEASSGASATVGVSAAGIIE
jgi:prepilin-type N-terminal cleavage/methylation domain-containing protein